MSGYVYLIGSPTFSWYKIGKSSTPDTRVKQLGILLPFKIDVIAIWRADNHHELERLLHEKYSPCRVNGEWFRFERKQVSAFLSSMPKSIESASLEFTNIKRDAPEGKKVIVRFRRDDSMGIGAEGRIKDLLAENRKLREQLKESAGSHLPAEELKYGS